ncbi:MAG TPA: prolyl oligopeptidase family serine peptidase [Thermoanaerobaculia bacterium]|jgi:dipeptidyl aminopeptidase/acylaminoacyl peptidase|nr:prolyl oligopeptidase family serine peptidase [Thermoanaerobaculia bacterium]
MRSLRTSLFLALLLLSSSLAAQKPTLESILSAPFPSEILASPSGGRLTWIQNERGVFNLWVASPPDYRGRQVTRYEKEDGQYPSNVEWTPDGKTLFYVRGEGGNRQGESPNPTSNPAGAEQAVWRVSADGGEPVKIGPGSSVAASPRGDGVALTRKGQILWAPLDGKTEPAPLIQTRGGSGSLRWSPDGSKLAFVSNRGDHSFVGVYDMAGKTVRWLAPGVDSDGEPAWSPDGKRVAFLRTPARKVFPLFRPNRETQPWSILVADAATGQATTVWRAREGMGSAFHEMEAANQIIWGAGDRLVFPWEGNGWLHLYSVPVSGGEATLLTPGELEVEVVVPTRDRRELLVVSNQGDIDRRHLWRVAVSGGPPVAVTRGDENEWMPAITDDGKALAYIRSGARRQAQAMVRVGSGEARELAPGSVPASFPESELVVPEPVIYSAADGLRIHGQLFKPRDLKPGEKRPAVIFLHGGSFRQMILGWHYRQYYNYAYGMNQYLASRGYVVLAINYRAGIGYGLKFREAENTGAAGASEFNDVLGAGLYLRSRPDVDPGRIGLWGGSYGGYLTALGLARASDLFAAGVDFHGVHNWNVGIRNFIPDYAPTPEEERLAFQSSPMAALDTWRSPVLLIHGDDDRNVSFTETVDLAEELRKRKVDVEILVLPDEVHSFLLHSSWLAAYHAAADFLDRKLRDGH